MTDQVTDGGVDSPDLMDAELVVDPSTSQDASKTTTHDDATGAKSDEKTQVEKTFTQAELDEIISAKTAKLARQRDKERSQREASEQELARLRPAPQTENKPQIGQYSDPEDYADALADWKLGQVAAQRQAQEVHKAQSTFASRVAEFREDLEDVPGVSFDKLARLPLSDAAVEAILDSDMRVKIAAHLLGNKADVERISQLTPARQAVELGKLEMKLSTEPTKKISQAPSPITPIGGKGTVVTADLYDPKFAANTDAWIAHYNKTQADKRKR